MKDPIDLSNEEFLNKHVLHLLHLGSGHVLVAQKGKHQEITDIGYDLLINLIVIHRDETYLLVHVRFVFILVLLAQPFEEQDVLEIAHNESRRDPRFAVEHPYNHLIQDDRKDVEDLLWLKGYLVLDGLDRIEDGSLILGIMLFIDINRKPGIEVLVIRGFDPVRGVVVVDIKGVDQVALINLH